MRFLNGGVGFGVVLLGILVLPALFRRPRRQDFFLAGSRASPRATAASLLATCLGASATVGVIARAYQTGWPAFWWLGSGAIGLLVLGCFWAGPMRRLAVARTLPQWAETGYGAPARMLAAGLIVVMWIAVVAAQWVAAAAVLAGALDWPLATGVVVAMLTVVLYTVWGGQAAVLRTDMVQILLIAGAVLVALWYALKLGPDATVAVVAVPSVAPPVPFRFRDWLALMVVVGGMYVVGPDIYSRIRVARNEASARRAAVGAGLLLVPASAAAVAIGVLLRRAGAPVAAPMDALPWLLGASGVVPAWAGALISLGLLAAMLSSADTCLLTAATVLELDVLGRNRAPPAQAFSGRLFVLLLGVLSAALAIRQPQIIPNLLLAYSFYCGGLLLPLLLLAWPRAAAAVPRAWVWAAMALGGLIPVLTILADAGADRALAGLRGVAICAAVLGGGVLAKQGRGGAAAKRRNALPDSRRVPGCAGTLRP